MASIISLFLSRSLSASTYFLKSLSLSHSYVFSSYVFQMNKCLMNIGSFQMFADFLDDDLFSPFSSSSPNQSLNNNNNHHTSKYIKQMQFLMTNRRRKLPSFRKNFSFLFSPSFIDNWLYFSQLRHLFIKCTFLLLIKFIRRRMSPYDDSTFIFFLSLSLSSFTSMWRDNQVLLQNHLRYSNKRFLRSMNTHIGKKDDRARSILWL